LPTLPASRNVPDVHSEGASSERSARADEAPAPDRLHLVNPLDGYVSHRISSHRSEVVVCQTGVVNQISGAPCTPACCIACRSCGEAANDSATSWAGKSCQTVTSF